MLNFKYSKEDVERAVEGAKFYSDICRNLGIVPSGGNYSYVKLLLSEYKINFNISKTPWNYGIRYMIKHSSLDDILNNKVPYYNSSRLRKRLIESQLKQNCCEVCGIDGNSVSLELHHIDGNHCNNSLDNLQILCPNCHSKTENYRIYNSVRYDRKKKIVPLTEEEVIQRDKARRQKDNVEKHIITKKIHKEPTYCLYCGKEFYPRKASNKYCCLECYRNVQKKYKTTITCTNK